MLHELRRTGSTAAVLDRMADWEARQRLVGKPFYDELSKRYAIAAQEDSPLIERSTFT